MELIVPILPNTLDLIEALNGGKLPEIPRTQLLMYYVWKGPDQNGIIMTQAERDVVFYDVRRLIRIEYYD